MARSDLYRIDDVLLRAGGLAALAVAGLAAGLVVVGLAQAGPGPGDPGLRMLRSHVGWLLLAAACPVSLVAAGVSMRRREKRTLAFHRLIERNGEIPVPELVAHSDHTRADLERSVRLLNNKGLGFYVWDREADVIRDGRLESFFLHVEKCDVCRASIALRVPASLREIPCCPYCSDPIPVESLQILKREALARLRDEAPAAATPQRTRPARAGRGRSAFSLPVFLLLLVLFWPAAILYGWVTWQRGA